MRSEGQDMGPQQDFARIDMSEVPAWVTLWGRRRFHANPISWWRDAYAGLSTRFPILPLPGRRRALRFQLRGYPGDFFVRPGSSDRWILSEILMRGEYADIVSRVQRPVGHILDLGTNAGFSVRYWRFHFPDAQIATVEPEAANCTIAGMNIAAGACPEKTWLCQAFIAAEEGEACVERGDGIAAGFRMADASATSSERIRKMTVPAALLQWESRGGIGPNDLVDLLKCDIEGTEAELFRSCRPWIGRVRHIIVEVHAPYGPGDLVNDLRSNGAEITEAQVTQKQAGLALVYARLNGHHLPREAPTSAAITPTG